MEYTVQKLAAIAGISARAIRFYDEIGLLKPARISSAGYRIYGAEEIDRLQQILFFRELDVPLDQIGAIMNDPAFSRKQALLSHRENLMARRRQLDILINNVERSLVAFEGGYHMKDKKKFEGFKKKLVDDNESRFGQEVRQKYGDESVDRSNRKLMGMTEDQYDEATRLAEAVRAALEEAVPTGDPAGELARKAVELHRQWLSLYWDHYTPEAHVGLGQTYVDDPRFTAYYDKDRPGTAIFLRDAIKVHAGKKN